MKCSPAIGTTSFPRINLLLFTAIGLFGFGGCGTTPPSKVLTRHAYTGPHMGTLWRVTLYAPDAPSASNAVRAAFARVAALEEVMSDYDPDSELERLRKSPVGQPVKVSDDLFDILRRAQEVSRQTDGGFDVTIGPEVQLWRRARRRRALPDPAVLEAARQAVGYENLRLDAEARTVTLLTNDMRLDLGGIGKGYAADEALRVLRERGLPRALVAASGDLAIGDPPPGKRGWRVGIGLPDRPADELAGLLLLRNAGVSTSGDTWQFLEIDGIRYSHLVDPRTGIGLTNRLQATVVADCATRSDPLATSVCVLGPRAGLEMIRADPTVAVCLVLPTAGTNRVIIKSPGWWRYELNKTRTGEPGRR